MARANALIFSKYESIFLKYEAICRRNEAIRGGYEDGFRLALLVEGKLPNLR
jgi:hypothetical protein